MTVGQLAYIIPDDGTPEIDFDLILGETHTNTSAVTDHPVEKGVNVADHVKPEPIEYSLEGWITNSPSTPVAQYGGSVSPQILSLPLLPPPASPFSLIQDAISGPQPPAVIQSLAFPTSFDRIADTHKALTALERSGGTSTIVTSTKSYDSMVLIKVTYHKEDAGAASFSCDFKQILIVSTSTVSAPKPIEPRGTPAAAKGNQATSPTDAAGTGGVSLAKKAINAAGKFIGALQ